MTKILVVKMNIKYLSLDSDAQVLIVKNTNNYVYTIKCSHECYNGNGN